MKIRSRTPAGELFPALVDVLLMGWSCPVRPDDADPFAIFRYHDRELRDVWRKYRSELLEEAARRGIPRPWAHVRFELDVPPWLRDPQP